MIGSTTSSSLLAILGLSLPFLLQGCACTEEVSLLNETEHVLHVQLALPWPSNAIASRNGCQFDFKLPPGDTWTSTKSGQEDRRLIPLRMANGPTVCRVRRLRGKNESWFIFYTNTRDPVVISVWSDGAQSLRVRGSLAGGKPADFEQADDVLWFDSTDAH